MSLDPDNWITELEALQVKLDNIDILSKMTNCNLMISTMNSLSEQYYPIVDNLEIRLMKKGDNPDELTLDNLHENLSNCCTCIINKDDDKSDREQGLNENFQRWFNFRKYQHQAVESKLHL